MTFETVYDVAKSLSIEEQILLLKKLQKDFKEQKKSKRSINKLISREDAITYFLEHIFNKNSQKEKIIR